MHNQGKAPPKAVQKEQFSKLRNFGEDFRLPKLDPERANCYTSADLSPSLNFPLSSDTNTDYVVYNNLTGLRPHRPNQATLGHHELPRRPPTDRPPYYVPCSSPPSWGSDKHQLTSEVPYSSQTCNSHEEENGLLHQGRHCGYDPRGTNPAYKSYSHEESFSSAPMLSSEANNDIYFCKSAGFEVPSTTELKQDRLFYSSSASTQETESFGPRQKFTSILSPPVLSSAVRTSQYIPSHSSPPPRRDSFSHSQTTTLIENERGTHETLVSKPTMTTTRTSVSSQPILCCSGNFSYSSKRERDVNHARHVIEPSPPETRALLQGNPSRVFSIPPGAPLLHVPTDLPVSTTSLLDLVANFVLHGGPTFEEELLFRERNNPYFDFLRAAWNDPRVLYYRWRLYSLLQGDSMLEWRTEPFQMERSGSKAYVWVPPPAIAAGPACLAKAFFHPKHDETDGVKKSFLRLPEDRRSEVTDIRPRENVCELPPPSAAWLSRQNVREGRVFTTLSEAEEKAWRELLNTELLLPIEVVAGLKSTNDKLGDLFSSSCDTPIPPLDKRAKTHHPTVNAPSWPGTAESIAQALLNTDIIAERMVFAVEHAHASLHVWSILLDEIVKLAYACASETHKEPRSTFTPVSEISTTESEVWDWNSEKYEQNKPVKDSVRNPIRMHVACFQILFYLFIVHDIIQNANTTGLVCSGTVDPFDHRDGCLEDIHSLSTNHTQFSRKNKQPRQSTQMSRPYSSTSVASSVSCDLPVSTQTASSVKGQPIPAFSAQMLLQEVEAVLPTLIEAILLVAFASLDYFSKRLDENNTLGRVQSIKNDHNARGCLAHSKEPDVFSSEANNKTLKAGLNVWPENADAVRKCFPHLAAILTTSTARADVTEENPTTPVLDTPLHEAYMQLIVKFPDHLYSDIFNFENATSMEREQETTLSGKNPNKRELSCEYLAQEDHFGDIAGVVRARLILVWLREFLCWWMRYTPEPFSIRKGEEMDSSNIQKYESSKEGVAPEVMEVRPFPASENVIRGRTTAMLVERYSFLFNNAYL